MAYSSFGSLLLFFFLPARVSPPLSPVSALPHDIPLLAPSFAAPCTLFGQGTKEDRWKDAGGSGERKVEKEKERERERGERKREKEAFLCLCMHGSRSYIAYNAYNAEASIYQDA